MLVLTMPASLAPAGSPWPAEVERALERAGANRPELERVLEHCRRDADPEKLRAAEFLVANMEGHGYVVNAFFDEAGNEAGFDALAYPDFAHADAAFRALEASRGPLHYARKAFVADLEAITAAYLIEDIDLAFEAWRGRPWASAVSFEAFCEHILPYRGSNEPIEPWRAACTARLAGPVAALADPRDAAAAAQLVRREAQRWVGFDSLYYLHPTDQGYAEMCATRRGRCEDTSNMLLYAFRASAVVAAQDYTPWWADRDNNHAWEVLLDEQGRGRSGLAHRAAKVYRKTYSIQPDSLGFARHEGESVPRWLEGLNYRDVTAEYMETTDVTVRLAAAAPEGARFAYLCVFNAGEWRPICWARIEDGQAHFARMGRRIAYLPAYFVDGAVVPAAPPFLLGAPGGVRLLDGGAGAIAITAGPRGAEGPAVTVKPGARYELFAWDGGWQSLGLREVGEAGAAFDAVPGNRLYWLVAEGSDRLERIFTVEDGRRTGW
jgi:hypothetical protein